MAFSSITAAQIITGKPTAQELFQKIKDDLDDHESRLDDVEAAVQTYPPIQFKVRGAASIYAPIVSVEHQRIFNNIRLTAGRVFVFTAGVSGTAEIDVLYKRGVAAFASIFSVRPSVAFGAGDYALSSNGIVSVTDLDAGDIIRLDLVSAQVDCEEFDVYLPYDVRT